MLSLQELQLMSAFLERTLVGRTVSDFEYVSLCNITGQLIRRELAATLAAEEEAQKELMSRQRRIVARVDNPGVNSNWFALKLESAQECDDAAAEVAEMVRRAEPE